MANLLRLEGWVGGPGADDSEERLTIAKTGRIQRWAGVQRRRGDKVGGVLIGLGFKCWADADGDGKVRNRGHGGRERWRVGKDAHVSEYGFETGHGRNCKSQKLRLDDVGAARPRGTINAGLSPTTL